MIIAIDGPAGSGKSTTARDLAEALDGFYLDTGAMYRAMALAFKRAGTPLTEPEAARFVEGIRIDLTRKAGNLHVLLNGEDVSTAIRSPEITRLSSQVSQLPSVRTRLVSEQRRLAQSFSTAGGAVVVEGRDIGTVVFPDADVKFFMVADLHTRARRRLLDLEAQGTSIELEDVLDDIRQRDRQDEEREHSPLRRAEDAIEVDTTELTPSEQLRLMLGLIGDHENQENT